MKFKSTKKLMCRFLDSFCWVRSKLTEIGALAHEKHFLTLTILVLCSLSSYASEPVFPYKSCFEASANKFDLDPNFLAAVASVESSFNPLAESS